MTLLIIALFIAAALFSIPIAHSLVLASVAGLLIIDRVPVHLAVEQMITQTQSFPLIAIPFFMMTGALMVSGRLGQSLVNLLTMMIGRVHGGPAQVGVLSSTIFGGVSGSAVADASAIGSMLIPWLKKLGYPAPFAAGTLAAAATIDILIPPSIPMIVYALVSGASIGALFVAGILPGLLMCGGFMLVCYIKVAVATSRVTPHRLSGAPSCTSCCMQAPRWPCLCSSSSSCALALPHRPR